jgi:hypothetical protein
MTRKSIKLFKEELCNDSRHWYQNFIAAHYIDIGYPRILINTHMGSNMIDVLKCLDENISALDWDIQGDYLYFTDDSDRTLYMLIFN